MKNSDLNPNVVNYVLCNLIADDLINLYLFWVILS